jgi:hypothetical protein
VPAAFQFEDARFDELLPLLAVVRTAGKRADPDVVGARRLAELRQQRGLKSVVAFGARTSGLATGDSSAVPPIPAR